MSRDTLKNYKSDKEPTFNSKVRSVAKRLRSYARYASYDLRANMLGQVWPLKPKTINLLVNDICNSKCQMCLIWTRKRDHEISPAELTSILQDPLFSSVQYVGVSGGEPTLRSDLPYLFNAIVTTLPEIKSAGIITNAIREGDVIERVSQSAEICQKSGVNFNLMVSLDGVGKIHDVVRGREGNFDSAMTVIDHFRNLDSFPVSFGATITKDNVWHVDELLDFVQAKGLYGRFRVAEYIQRLYNDTQTEYVRNFTPLEAYHLALFFGRLESEFEKNPIYRRTYRNIRDMLLLQTKRKKGCPYQTQAVVLDSRGQLLYCAPKSPSLGSAVDDSAKSLYLKNLSVRKQIIDDHCDTCIHDYHAPPTIKEMGEVLSKRYWLWRFRPKFALWQARNLSPDFGPIEDICSALIIGWYGTETAGDKAILGEILHRLKQSGVKDKDIALASLHPYLSHWTIRELGFPNIKIVPTYSAQLIQKAQQVDVTIMGGGPLMEIKSLGAMLSAFVAAKKAGKSTLVAGCGIGPLHGIEYTSVVKAMLHLADRIELRDKESIAWAERHTGRSDIHFTGDPAYNYVKRWRKKHSTPVQKNTLNCYLREWSPEYKGQLSYSEFQRIKENFRRELGEWIRDICHHRGLRPRLLAMHHFHIGGDDRKFNRRFAAEFLPDLNPIVENRPYSVDEILTSMQEGRINVTMRFHSVLFSHVLNTPYIAIDYTRGGKIQAFLRDEGALNRLIDLSDVASGDWRGWMKHTNFYERFTD